MATSTIAEAYMGIVLELLRDAIDPTKWAVGASSGGNNTTSSSQQGGSQSQSNAGLNTSAVSNTSGATHHHTTGNAGGASLDPPEEYLSSVLRRYEPRITNLFRGELNSLMPNLVTDIAAQLHRSGVTEGEETDITTALTRRLHASKVVDIILAVRGGVSQFILSGGHTSRAGTSSSHDALSSLDPSPTASKGRPADFSDVRTSKGTTSSSGESNHSEPSLVTTIVHSVFRASGLLRLFLDPSAARRCCALLDIVWMQSVFIVLGGIVETERVSAFLASPTGNGAGPLPMPFIPHSASSPEKLASLSSPNKALAAESLRQATPLRKRGTAPLPTISDLAYVPVVFFLRRQHISDIESLIVTWILRDVDVYPTYRRWIQHWSFELLAMVCCVDSTVSHPSVIGVQDAVSARYSELEIDGRSSSGRKEPLDYVLHFIARESHITPTSPLQVVLKSNGTSKNEGDHSPPPPNYPVILTPSMTFVDKYTNAIMTIRSDLSAYKNYSGLLKYVRIVSSWRVASNGLLIILTSILVELVAVSKGKKELKAIIAEFCTRLLVPVANTPHHRVDAWVFRNCEFLHTRLTEWIGKAKYVPVAIPAIAAVLGCCSIPYFVRQVIPFCQLVAKSLPDADRRMRGSYLLALQHVVGVCFRQVLTHSILGADAAAGALRRDLFAILQNDIAVNLRRTPLTQQSTKSVEAATELFLLAAQCFPVEALTILVEMLPALDGAGSGSSSSATANASGLLFSEATAVALNTLGALSDVMFSVDAGAGTSNDPRGVAHSQPQQQNLLPQFRLAFQVWGGVDTSTIVPPKATVDEDLLSGGILTFPSSPFCTIRRQPSTSGVASPALSSYGVEDAADRCATSSHASLFYSSREHWTASWGDHQFGGPAGAAGAGRAVPAISIFSEHGWDDELDAACRKVGTSFLNWGVVLDPEQQLEASLNSMTPDKPTSFSDPATTISVGRDFLNSKENFLLKRLTSVLFALRDLLNVPHALRSAMKQLSSDASSGSGGSSSAAATILAFSSTLSEKERMSQRLLIATFLVSRYWAPTSSFLSEIPKALLHWNHSLVLATSAIVLPHFYVHRTFHHYVQPILAKFVEVAAVTQDDRETTVTLAKAIANMSSLLRCKCAEEVRRSVELTAMRSHHHHHHQSTSSSSGRRLYEPFVKWLLAAPPLPTTYYFAAPAVAPVGAVEMQTMSPLDLLDGVGLVFLGNHDHATRQSALSILSDVVRITDTMGRWKSVAVPNSPPIPTTASAAPAASAPSLPAALLVDWKSYVCIGHSLVGSYGLDTVEECVRQIDDCRFVGCNWSDEATKNLRLVSLTSCYAPASAAAAGTTSNGGGQLRRNPSSSSKSPLTAAARGTPRLLYPHAQDVLRFHSVTDPCPLALGDHLPAVSPTVFANNGTVVADVLRPASAPLPFVFVANIALDFVARAVTYTTTRTGTASISAFGVSRAALVAAKLAAYVFVHVASGSSSSGSAFATLESRYAMDAWRSSYCLYYTLLMIEARPGRRVPLVIHGGGGNGGGAAAAQSPPDQANDGWLIPDKAKRLPELLQLTLVTLQRFNGVQDVFDVVSFLSSVIVHRVLDSSLKDVVALTPEYSRLHIDFVKKFLDDPVKSLARKDKKRALAYCAIACPTLLAAAISISSPLPQIASPTAPTLPRPQQTNSALQDVNSGSMRGASPQGGGPSHHQYHDVQLQAVKLFDAFDVLVSVLVSGNFSSTVAGSNAPTSSSSVTFTPQQHELLKSGGVSSLAALSPIPPANFIVTQRNASDAIPLGSHRLSVEVDVVASYHSDEPLPLSSVVVDELRGAPHLHSVVWSSSAAQNPRGTPRGGSAASISSTGSSAPFNTAMSLDQSFSVRLRAALIEMLGVFYQHELLLLPFLRERHRSMEEFLLFNVIGAPSRTVTRALMDSQCLTDRMEIGYSMRPTDMWETSTAVAPPFQKAAIHFPVRCGDPPHAFSAALRHLLTVVGFSTCGGGSHDPVSQQRLNSSLQTSGTLKPQGSGSLPGGPASSRSASSGGLQLLTRLLDAVLDTYLANLNAWSKVTTTQPFRSSYHQAPFPFPSCFTTESPFREALVRVSSDASWSPQAFRMLYHRLQDTNAGSAEYLFFSEAMICFLNANPQLILTAQSSASGQGDDDQNVQQKKVEAGGGVRRKVHGHQLFRDEPAPPPHPSSYLESPRGPLVISTCLLVIGATEAGVNDTLRRAADDLLLTIHRALHLHDSGSGGRGGDASDPLMGGSDRMQHWLRILLQQHAVIYHPTRQRNQYNRIVEVILHRLQTQRLVRTPTWVGVHFAVLAKLLTSAELNEDIFRGLVVVCRLYRADAGDECLASIFSALDQSTPDNQARVAIYIMKLDDPEDLMFVLQCLRRFYVAPTADAPASLSEPHAPSLGRRGSFSTKLSPPPHAANHFSPPAQLQQQQRTAGQGLVFTLFCHSLKQLIQLRTVSWCKPSDDNGLTPVNSGTSSGHFTQSAATAAANPQPPTHHQQLPPSPPPASQQPAPSKAATVAAASKNAFILSDESLWTISPTTHSSQRNPSSATGSPKGVLGHHKNVLPGSASADVDGILDAALSIDEMHQASVLSSLVHSHDLSPAQRLALDNVTTSIQLLAPDSGAPQPNRPSAQMVLERAKKALFVAHTAPDLECWLLKPLRAVLTCFASVADIVAKRRRLLCDAAAELGMGERVPRHLFMRERKPVMATFSGVAHLAPATLRQQDEANARRNLPISASLDSPNNDSLQHASVTPPMMVSPSRKFSPASKFRIGGAAAPRPNAAALRSGDDTPSLAFPYYPQAEEDEESFMSNTSQATFLVHDDVAHHDPLLFPAQLHSSISGFTHADEASMTSRALGASGRRATGAPKDWIVDEAALGRELFALVSEAMVLSTTHAIDTLLTSFVPRLHQTICASKTTCVQCIRRKQQEGNCIITGVRSLKPLIGLWQDAQLVRTAARKDDDEDDDHTEWTMKLALNPSSAAATFSMAQSMETLSHLEGQIALLSEGRNLATMEPELHEARCAGLSSQLMQLVSLALPLPVNKTRLREGLDYIQRRLPDVMSTMHTATIFFEDNLAKVTLAAIATEARHAHYYLQSITSQFTFLSKSNRIAATSGEAASGSVATDEHERRGVSVFLLAPSFRGVLSLCTSVDGMIYRQRTNAATPTSPVVLSAFAFLSDCLHSSLSTMFRVIDPTLNVAPGSALQHTDRILSENEVLECLWTSLVTVVCGEGTGHSSSTTTTRDSAIASYRRPSASSSALWWSLESKVRTMSTLIQRGCLVSGLSIALIPKSLAVPLGDDWSGKHGAGLSPLLLTMLRRMTPECLFAIGTIIRVVTSAEAPTSTTPLSSLMLDRIASQLGLESLVETVSNSQPKVGPFFASLSWLLFPHASKEHARTQRTTSPDASVFLDALRCLMATTDGTAIKNGAALSFGANLILLSTKVFGEAMEYLFVSGSNLAPLTTERTTPPPPATISPATRWAISPPDDHLGQTNTKLSSSSIADSIMDDYKERLSMFLVAPVVWLVCQLCGAASSAGFDRALHALDAIMTHPKLRSIVMSLLDEALVARLYDALTAARRSHGVGGRGDHASVVVCSRLLSLLACWVAGSGTEGPGNCSTVVSRVVELLDHLFDNSAFAGLILQPPTSTSPSQTDPLNRSLNPSPLDGNDDDDALAALLGSDLVRDDRKATIISMVKSTVSVTGPLAASSSGGGGAASNRGAFQVDWWPDFPTSSAADAVRALEEDVNEDLTSPIAPRVVHQPPAPPRPPFMLETSFLPDASKANQPPSSPGHQQRAAAAPADPRAQPEAVARPLYMFNMPYVFCDSDDGDQDSSLPRRETVRTLVPEVLDHLQRQQYAGVKPWLAIATQSSVVAHGAPPQQPPCRDADDDNDSLRSLQSEDE